MANRPKRLGSRASLFLLGAIVILQVAATLQKGEPDYRNQYNRPVSARVAPRARTCAGRRRARAVAAALYGSRRR